jgi:hypothetical protein
MWEFLQNYGIWIVFGVLFLLMMRMHRGGMHGNGMGGGCGMGMSHDHNQHNDPSHSQRVVPSDDRNRDPLSEIPSYSEDVNTQEKTSVREISTEEGEIPVRHYPVGHPTGDYRQYR